MAQGMEQRGNLSHIISAGTNPDAVLVKSGPVELLKLWIFNVNAAARFVKLYNKATAPVVGTDTPVATFGVGGATTGVANNIDLGQHPELAGAFTLGLGVGISTAAADSDTGAPTAGDVAVALMIRK